MTQSASTEITLNRDDNGNVIPRTPIGKLLADVADALRDYPELLSKIKSAVESAEIMHEDLYQTRTRAENWINELTFARDALSKAGVDCNGKHGVSIHYGIQRLVDKVNEYSEPQAPIDYVFYDVQESCYHICYSPSSPRGDGKLAVPIYTKPFQIPVSTDDQTTLIGDWRLYNHADGHMQLEKHDDGDVEHVIRINHFSHSPVDVALQKFFSEVMMYADLHKFSRSMPTISDEDRSYLIQFCEQEIHHNQVDSKTYYGGDTTPEAKERNSIRQQYNLDNVQKFTRLLNAFKSVSTPITSLPEGWHASADDSGYIRLTKCNSHGGATWTVGYSPISNIFNEKGAAMLLTDIISAKNMPVMAG